jgi:hypothetical protein
MAIVDVDSVIYSTLWAMLEGRATWAALVKPGNRIKVQSAVVGAQPKKTATQVADFPQAILLPIGGADSGPNLMRTFGTPSGCTAQPRDFTLRFMLGITHRGIDLAANNGLVQETRAAFTTAFGTLNTAIAAVATGSHVRDFTMPPYTSDRTGERTPPFPTTGVDQGGHKRAWDSMELVVTYRSPRMGLVHLT